MTLLPADRLPATLTQELVGTDNDTLLIVCQECRARWVGTESYIRVVHNRKCQTRAQPVAVREPVRPAGHPDDGAATLVRSGRAGLVDDALLVEMVRAGIVTVSDAMNRDM